MKRPSVEVSLIVGLVLAVCGLILRGWFVEMDALRGRMASVEDRVDDAEDRLVRLYEAGKAARREEKEDNLLTERREFRKSLTAVLRTNQEVLAKTQEVLATIVAPPTNGGGVGGGHGR